MFVGQELFNRFASEISIIENRNDILENKHFEKVTCVCRLSTVLGQFISLCGAYFGEGTLLLNLP